MMTLPTKTLPTKTLISRREVAELIGVTYVQVMRNEKRWGLDKARRDLTPRCVRYVTRMVVLNFQGRGWI